MEPMQKKKFLLNHRKSSAFVVSVLVHVAFIAVALTFVAVQVYVKPEQTFEVKEIKRPKMQLRKLQVPVKQQKKTQAPKLRKTIVAKTKVNVDIKMPELVGVKGGTGYGSGTGLGGLGFGFDMDLFGSSKSKGEGNEFIGHFYDLKQTPRHELTAIGRLAEKDTFNQEAQSLCMQVINSFVSSGMRATELRDYFVAPKQKYATAFNFPPMGANEAPKAFGVDNEVKPSYWICVYRGQIVAPEDGKYRFVGLADDVLIVRANRRVVLDACWPEHIGRMTNWSSRDDDNRKFQINRNNYGSIKGTQWLEVFPVLSRGLKAGEGFSGLLGQIKGEDGSSLNGNGSYMCAANRLVMGDWMNLKKGQRIDMEVLIGEIPGGFFGCRLLVEEKDRQYAMVDSDAGKRPVLPIFKTVPVNEKLVSKMNADPNEITLEGPSFGALNASQTAR